jgi:hypothetical protein
MCFKRALLSGRPILDALAHTGDTMYRRDRCIASACHCAEYGSWRTFASRGGASIVSSFFVSRHRSGHHSCPCTPFSSVLQSLAGTCKCALFSLVFTGHRCSLEAPHKDWVPFDDQVLNPLELSCGLIGTGMACISDGFRTAQVNGSTLSNDLDARPFAVAASTANENGFNVRLPRLTTITHTQPVFFLLSYISLAFDGTSGAITTTCGGQTD